MPGLRPKAVFSGAAVLITVASLVGQTPVVAPKNRYSPADDVQLGREAAAQVEQQLPVMRDEEVSSYLTRIGRSLVAAIPPEFQHPEFRYTFQPVNVKEINAFALPGGPMFINRGMMQAARTEGEIAGVMAHEMSHVALRHGTAQQTAATKYEIGQIAGAVIGAIIGGRTGSVIAQGTQFGLGAAFLRFSREYERQADILGSHIMAQAGYDPRDMANVFKTIQKQGGSGGPQWLSDHPDPGDRYAYINREAQLLRVANQTRDTREFQQVQAHLRTLPPAPSTEQATRTGAGRAPTSNGPVSRPDPSRVERPSSSFTTYTEGNVFRVAVPSNWREVGGSSSVTFAPDGAYGTVGQQNVFTHGVEMGISRNETHDLRTASDELLQSLGQSNPGMSQPPGYDRTSIGGLPALHTVVSNVSEVTGGEERIAVYTALMRDGSLFYVLGVAPGNEFRAYDPTFRKVVGSIQLAR